MFGEAGGSVRKTSKYTRSEAARYLAWGLLATTVLVTLKIASEATALGKWAESETRALLFSIMPSFRDDGPIARVLDISNVPGGDVDPETKKIRVTSRKMLLALLEQLVIYRPAAIGIDVDFSTSDGSWVDPGDVGFLDRCLKLSQDSQVPIVLGVSNSIADPRGQWLNLPEFNRLAAAIYVTDSASGRLPLWVRRHDSPHRLMTLGAALAVASSTGESDPYRLDRQPSFLRALIFGEGQVTTKRHLPSNVSIESLEMPVNYSVIRQLEREHIPKPDPGDIAKYAASLENRIVLLGDANAVQDEFQIPSSRDRHAGVFLHAAQVHSLIKEPIREFGHTFRIVLDFAISLAILTSVVLVRFRRGTRSDKMQAALESKLLTRCIFMVFVGGVVLLSVAEIFWVDFVLVGFFLILHKPTESHLHELFEGGHAK